MADFIIGTIVILLMAAVGYKVYKDRKNGSCGCGDCSGCSQKSCPSEKDHTK